MFKRDRDRKAARTEANNNFVLSCITILLIIGFVVALAVSIGPIQQ